MRSVSLTPLLVMVGIAIAPDMDAQLSPPARAAGRLASSAQNQSSIRQIHGINFSPYLDGQDPNRGTVIGTSQIMARMQIVAPYVKWVRSFSSTHGLENIPAIARQLGLKVAANAWISKDRTQNQIEINNLIAAANAGLVDIAIVGSEAILRNNVTVSELIAYMNQVREAIPANIPVTTADVWGVFIAHPNLISASDVVFVNLYPYWEGTSIDNALCSLAQAYQQVVNASGSKTVVISEAGWPSAGNAVGAAVPSVENANQFALQFLTWAEANNVQAFYFEAFNEAWKVSSEGPQGAHWGIWDTTGAMKPGMDAFFNGQIVPVNCNATIPGPVAIKFPYVPPYGTSDQLEVQVTGVNSANHVLAAYIYAYGGWWTKPTFASPTVPINPDGTARITIVSNSSYDPQATDIAVFLIPANVVPPSAGGGGLPSIPEAVASLQVHRTQSSIRGTIMDSQNRPIRGAVIADPLLGSTTSAPSGKYSFYNITASGTATLTVTHPNYAFPTSPSTQNIPAANLVVNFNGVGVAVTPASGSGSAQTFSVLYADATGSTDLNYVQMAINATLSAVNACYVHHYRGSNQVWLLNDATSGWMGPMTLGSGGTLQNSQCIVSGSGSSVSGSGNNLTLNLALTFKPAFAGGKTIYMLTGDNGGFDSGWQARGAWTVTSGGNLPPSADSVTPGSGSGSAQTFGFLYSDPNGFTDLNYVQMAINATLSAVNACYVHHYRGSNEVWLLNDATSGWMGPLALGSGGSLQNSQCVVEGSGSSVSGSGDNLTLNLALTFKPAFAGGRNIYMLAGDNGGFDSGWQARGAWTVTSGGNLPPAAVSVTPASGSGSAQTFSLMYSDPNGFTDLNYVQMAINATLNAASACYVQHIRGSNQVWLLNDGAGGWVGPLPLGSGGTLQNSQCTVTGSGSSVSGSGNNLTLNLALTFQPAFAGGKTIYMLAGDNGGFDSAWQTRGTWTAP